ncbi:hypothetical protein ACM55K_13460 [Flavobacterium sp. LT1R49]|uniref:hypothetical protein n=1 Tax=Flavobacterium arabinosi TaxID=3398737 RepID=UPI003A850BEB
MISESEFENALEIIASYQLQLKQNLNESAIVSCRKINIQDDLRDSTFRVLQQYYLDEHEILLRREDLDRMDVNLLSRINYEKLQGYRGFGKAKLYYFKKLMISHYVLKVEL